MHQKKPLAPTTRPTKKQQAVAVMGNDPAAASSKTTLHPVFVYGSLKKDFPLSDWLKDQDYVGTAVVSGYTLLSLGAYPAMIHTGREDDAVNGEYYLVSDNVFQQLRRMEERVGYSTVRVHGKFTKAATSALEASKFTANAWLFGSIQSGVAVWDIFQHNDDTYQYVNYHDKEKQP